MSQIAQLESHVNHSRANLDNFDVLLHPLSHRLKESVAFASARGSRNHRAVWGDGLTVCYFAGGLNPDHPAKSRIVGVDDLHARLISAPFLAHFFFGKKK